MTPGQELIKDGERLSAFEVSHKETLDSILCLWCFVALSEAINYCAAESHKN